MEEIKLLPCPFCGSEATIKDMGSNRFHIKCTKCQIQFGETWDDSYTKDFLISRWNNRIDSESKLKEAKISENEYWQDRFSRAFSWKFKGRIKELKGE